MQFQLPKMQARASMTEEAFNTLRKMILHGKLLPGERITESGVAAEMGISITPVREAFLKLEAVGFIVSKPHQSSQVPLLSLEELDQYVFIRSTLEDAYLEMILDHITKNDNDINALKVLVIRMRESLEQHDWEAYSKYHYRLHEMLLESLEWPLVTRFVMGIFDCLDRYRYIGEAHSLTRWAEDQSGHEELVQAIERRDREGFRSALIETQIRFAKVLRNAIDRNEEGIAEYFTNSVSA